MNKRHYYITPQDYKKANLNGISEDTLNTRVKKLGWDVDRAITQPVTKQNRIDKKWKDLAESNGVSMKMLYSRIDKGWSIERATTTPKTTKAEQLEQINRLNESRRVVFTLEEVKQAEDIGVEYKTLWQRVKYLGWDKSEAINTPLLTQQEAAKRAKEKSPWSHDMALMYKQK